MNTATQTRPNAQILTDQIVAGDLLNSSKATIRNCAIALTEATSPDVRATLHGHLNAAVQHHQTVFEYMHAKGWYEPHNMAGQLQQDIQAAQTVLQL